MKKIVSAIDRFWFAPMTSKGFGIMRVTFGIIAFTAFLWQWDDVARYYSDVGVLPHELIPKFLRTEYRFSILDYVGDPQSVFVLYLILVTSFALITLGVWTHLALVIATVLLFSFHERDPGILAGGDTVLRHIAFILLLSPCHRSFSLWSLERRFKAWMKGHKDPVDLIGRMPKWPYRLLLWQFAMIYIASGWTKMLGSLWRNGTAVELVLHHEHFIRVPAQYMLPLLPLGAFIVHFTLIAQFSWILVLLSPVLCFFFPQIKGSVGIIPWKRIAIVSNAIIHLMIFLLMDVGIFSLILFAGYVGLLTEDDFAAMRNMFNWRQKKKIHVLYDGDCGLCLRSIFFVNIFDWLKRVEGVNFRDAALRKKIAPKLTFGELDKAMHVIMPNGKTYKGFSGFRALTWHLPMLWIMAPFLYIPGVKLVGDQVYSFIAVRRNRCKHITCKW